MAREKGRAVLKPNLGLYLAQSALFVPDRAVVDGINFRVEDGSLTNRALGWAALSDWTLNGPVKLIVLFERRDGTTRMIFGTPKDIYRYEASTDTLTFLTPQYDEGTVAVSGTTVTGTSTQWSADGIVAGMEIAFSANENDPDATWYEIDEVGSDTSITLTESAGTISAGADYTIRQTFTDDDPLTFWDYDVFINDLNSGDDLIVFTNGVDDIMYWNGDDTTLSNAGLSFRARVVSTFSNMMIYANITDSGGAKPSSIINSDIGNPLDVSSGLAEEFVVHSGPDPIIEARPLGDSLALYSQNRVTMIQFVGDPLIFTFRQAVSNHGPFGARAVADFGDHHKFIAYDGAYIFDGATLVGVDMHVWAELIRTRAPEISSLIFHHFDDERGELIWSLPITGDTAEGGPSVATTEHYAEPVDRGRGEQTPYSRRDFPFTTAGYFRQQDSQTWANITGSWEDNTFRWDAQYYFAEAPLSLVGGPDGKIYTLNVGQTKDGTAFDRSYVRFPRRALYDGRVRGLISRIYPFARSVTGSGSDLGVTLYVSDFASGDRAATPTLPFDLSNPEGEFFVTPYRRGRYYEVEFGNDASSTEWTLDGYDLDARPGGRR